MALAGPAVTAMRPPKEIRLTRHIPRSLLDVTRAEIAPHNAGDQK